MEGDGLTRHCGGTHSLLPLSNHGAFNGLAGDNALKSRAAADAKACGGYELGQCGALTGSSALEQPASNWDAVKLL